MLAEISYNEEVVYKLPESISPEIKSVFFMSVHKSGSTLLNNVVKELCSCLEYSFVDIQSHFFNTGIPDNNIPDHTSEIFKKNGYVYSGFRYFPHQYEIEPLDDCKLILLLRDPRDAVVSQYFSITKSHPMPGSAHGGELYDHMKEMRKNFSEMDIDEFCLQEIQGFVKKLEVYDSLMRTHNDYRLFQYEEVIYLKKKWILNMLNFLGWKMGHGDALRFARKYDQFPSKEDANAHIRQVHPGNFRTKLKKETIAEINNKYRDVLMRFHYI